MTSTQLGSAVLFGFCQEIPWHRTCKNVMKEWFRFSIPSSFTINFLPTINPYNQIRHALKKRVFLMSLYLTIFERDFKSIPEMTHISLCY